jgi:CubicO group peptidase (beta-lactamase class C family)
VGSYGWGGAYHSTYWVDPQEGLVVSYVTQVIPATGLDDQTKIRALIYQALVD